MQSEPFEGRSAEMKAEGQWLSSEDLLGLGDVEVEISGVFRHKDAAFDDGRKQTVFSLAFKGKTRQLILNNTNRKILSTRFGGSAKEWIGRKIKLYVLPGVRKPGGAKGETTNGIRIR